MAPLIASLPQIFHVAHLIPQLPFTIKSVTLCHVLSVNPLLLADEIGQTLLDSGQVFGA